MKSNGWEFDEISNSYQFIIYNVHWYYRGHQILDGTSIVHVTFGPLYCPGHHGASYGLKCVRYSFFDYGVYILFCMTSTGVQGTILDTKSWTEHPFPSTSMKWVVRWKG